MRDPRRSLKMSIVYTADRFFSSFYKDWHLRDLRSWLFTRRSAASSKTFFSFFNENPYLLFLPPPQYENIIYSRVKVTRSKIVDSYYRNMDYYRATFFFFFVLIAYFSSISRRTVFIIWTVIYQFRTSFFDNRSSLSVTMFLWVQI